MSTYSPLVAYRQHKARAKRRKIGFELTFDEWWGIWEASGKYPERGRKGHEYCMARLKDRGPYAVGNVQIKTASENCREINFTDEVKERLRIAQTGRVLGPETRAKISKLHKGNQYNLGRKRSESALKKTSEAVSALRWATDGTKNIRIKFDLPLPAGFKYGRTVKKQP